MDKRNILETTRNADEKIALAIVLDKAMLCIKQHEKTFSDYLDPIKASRFLEIIGRERLDINIAAFGGLIDCERKILGFSPSYLELNNEDFPIAVIEVIYNTKFSRKLEHRDFLGSIMGMGITRGKVGDIILTEDGAIIFLALELADYVCINLEKVGSARVEARRKVKIENETADNKFIEQRLTVASLRLDSIISAVFHISRSKSANFIEGEKVFVNWVPVTRIAKQVVPNDVITVRGLGRVQLNEIAGSTKKDRIIINILKQG